MQQTAPQRLTRMHRHHGTLAIFVMKKVMAALNANDLKTGLHQGGDQFRAGDPRAATHAAMVIR